VAFGANLNGTLHCGNSKFFSRLQTFVTAQSRISLLGKRRRDQTLTVLNNPIA